MAAPVMAFQRVQRYLLASLGWFSAGLIVVATLLLLPEIGRANAKRKGEVVTEEVTD